MNLDLTKPIRTRDGREVKIYEVTDKWIIGRITNDEKPAWWWLTGGFNSHTPCNYDLINVPEEKTLWVNVFKGPPKGPQYKARVSLSKNIADLWMQDPNFISQHEIKIKV